MTQKAIDFKFVLPAASAIAFATMVSVAVFYLAGRYFVTTKPDEDRRTVTAGHRSVDRPNADGRLWRVHVLLR